MMKQCHNVDVSPEEAHQVVEFMLKHPFNQIEQKATTQTRGHKTRQEQLITLIYSILDPEQRYFLLDIYGKLRRGEYVSPQEQTAFTQFCQKYGVMPTQRGLKDIWHKICNFFTGKSDKNKQATNTQQAQQPVAQAQPVAQPTLPPTKLGDGEWDLKAIIKKMNYSTEFPNDPRYQVTDQEYYALDYAKAHNKLPGINNPSGIINVNN
jgi:hypothetical protein